MENFFISKNITLNDAMIALVNAGTKCLIVVDDKKKLLGSLSDGDVRRAILKRRKLNSKILSVYNRKPKKLHLKNYSIKKAKEYFLKYLVDVIPIVDSKNVVKDVLSLNDVFKNQKKSFKKPFNTEVVIMAGGLGKRLDPFTQILPKPLMPVNNKPIINHIIEKFQEFNISKFTISINYKSKILKAYFKENKIIKNLNFIEEQRPLGTVGCLSKFKLHKVDNFFLTNCDIIINHDYSDIFNFHKKNKNLLTVVASSRSYHIPYGDCKLDSSGRLEKFVEKPKINLLANTGFYLINKRVLSLIPKNKKYDINELIGDMIKKNINVGVYPISENSWIDIGNWDEYRKAVNKLENN